MSNIPRTSEGQMIADTIVAYYLHKNPDTNASIPPNKPPKLTKEQKEINDLNNKLIRIKTELAKMIMNSKLVIADCDVILTQCEDFDAYMLNDAKVAKSLHYRLIDRLSNIVNGEPAFEDETHLQIDVKKLNHKDRYMEAH